jgi:ribosomal protein S27AE
MLMDLEPQVIAEIEVVALHYLRLDNMRASFDITIECYARDVQTMAVTFASYGCSQYVRAFAQREPSMWWVKKRADILGECLDALFLDQENEQLFQAIETLLDIGLTCRGEDWHHFLLTWWRLAENKQLTTPSGSVHWSSAKSYRLWRATKLLIQHGVDLDSSTCVNHRKWSFGELRSCKAASRQCLIYKPPELLAQLAPPEALHDLPFLMSEHSSLPNDAYYDTKRRRRRAEHLRRARVALLASFSQDHAFDANVFEIQYINWVCSHESMVEPEFRLVPSWMWPSWHRGKDIDKYFAKHGDDDIRHNIVCSNCGLLILRSALDRWLCLSCLDVEYCTLCVSLVQAQHSNRLQRIERRRPLIRPAIVEEVLRGYECTENVSLDDAGDLILSNQMLAEIERKQPLPGGAGDFCHWLLNQPTRVFPSSLV